jgi:hypothetical protein
VNKHTKRNATPLPLIHVLIEELRDCGLFSKFDIRWGYNNVCIKEGDEWKAAFKTSEGLFEPQVMFFGLCNSPATFQGMMTEILRRTGLHEMGVRVYMDDILVGSRGDPSNPEVLTRHRMVVHKLLDVLEEYDLYLRPEKCTFEATRVEYLGLILEHNQIQMDPTKLSGLTEWPETLSSVKEVRSTLGVFGYHRPFIQGFANVARPLTRLQKKDTPFIWTPNCTTAI